MGDYDRIERTRGKFFEGEIDKAPEAITGSDVGLFSDVYYDAEYDQFELYIVEDGVRKFIKDLIPSEREDLEDDGTWWGFAQP